MDTSSRPQSSLPAAAAPALNKTSLVIGGLGLMAIGALAAVLLLGNRTPVAEPAPTPVVDAAPAPVTPPSPTGTDSPAAPAALSPSPAAPVTAATTAKPQAPKTASASATSPSPAAVPAPAARIEAAATATAPVAQSAPAAVPVCATCGVVTTVTAVEQKGEAGALGTVAGGVVGGVLGHQVGGGSGKTAMTVIGAVGGAMAGREVEKRQRSTTVYDTRVRMDDGSARSFTVGTALSVGQKVRVQGDQLSIEAPAGK